MDPRISSSGTRARGCARFWMRSPMMPSARASRRSIWRRFDKATPRALMDACFFRFAASSWWRTGSSPWLVIHWKYGVAYGEETYPARKQFGVGDRPPDPGPPQDRSRNAARCQYRWQATDHRARQAVGPAEEVQRSAGVGAQAIRKSVPQASRVNSWSALHGARIPVSGRGSGDPRATD